MSVEAEHETERNNIRGPCRVNQLLAQPRGLSEILLPPTHPAICTGIISHADRRRQWQCQPRPLFGGTAYFRAAKTA